MTTASPEKRWPARITRVATSGLYLFAFAARLAPSAAYLGLFLMELGAIARIGTIWRRLRREPLLWVALVFLIYLVARTLLAVIEFPQHRDLHLADAVDLAQLWLFVVVAWWLGADTRRALWVLGLALAGFVLNFFYRIDAEDVQRVATIGRSGFGMSALPFGLYCSVGVLGLLMLAPRFWGRPRRGTRFYLRLALWVVLLLGLSQGLILSGSRGSWLAMLLLAPPLVWFRLRQWQPRAEHKTGRRLAPVIVAVTLIASLFIYGNMDTLKTRFGWEAETIASIARLDPAQVRHDAGSSSGVRFHLYRYGWAKWRERPLLGWGPGASEPLIDAHEIEALHRWNHLHNSYLEVLVRLGLVGLIILAIGVWYLLRALRAARRAGTMAEDIHLYLVGVLWLLALTSFTDFRMIHSDWRFLWLLFGGLAYTYHLRTDATT